jgi:hypothetical protein
MMWLQSTGIGQFDNSITFFTERRDEVRGEQGDSVKT